MRAQRGRVPVEGTVKGFFFPLEWRISEKSYLRKIDERDSEGEGERNRLN